MDRYISLDLETTGLSNAVSEIMQIGAVKVIDGVVVDEFMTYVRTSFYVPKNIQDLTGITPAKMIGAPEVKVALQRFHAWCGELPFIGYNLPFDYGFLMSWGKRCEYDFSDFGNRAGLDVLKLARRLYQLDSYSLSDVCSYLGISHEAHDALQDARATMEVYSRMLQNASRYSGVVLPEPLSSGTYGRPTNTEVLGFD